MVGPNGLKPSTSSVSKLPGDVLSTTCRSLETAQHRLNTWKRTYSQVKTQVKDSLYNRLTAHLINLYVDKSGNWSFNGFIFDTNGSAYFPKSVRLGPRIYQTTGSVVAGSGCGGVEIKWNDSPNITVGDPAVGWRCIAGVWHSFGEIH